MDRVEEGVANFRQFQFDARDFFAEYRENRRNNIEFQDKRDKEIKDRLDAANTKLNQNIATAGLHVAKRGIFWTIVQACIGLAAVAVAILAIVATLYVAKHADTEPLDLFRHLQSNSVYAGIQPREIAAP